MAHPTLDQTDPAGWARTLYRRVLVGWASDALVLRASGLDRPGRRVASGMVSPLGSIGPVADREMATPRRVA